MIIVFLILIIYILIEYQFWRTCQSLKKIRILMYHSVENGVLSGMNVSPKKFESQLKYLKKNNWNCVKISDLKGENVKNKTVAITFDDGFENNFSQAFFLLQKYQIPATIYISTDIQNIQKLSDENIKIMLESGLIEIGAHTKNHVNLTKIDDQLKFEEITYVKEYIKSKFNTKCESFAYPFGRFDEKTIEIVKKCGYNSAVTTKKAFFDREKDDFFTIPRIGIHGKKIDFLKFYILLTRGRYKF